MAAAFQHQDTHSPRKPSRAFRFKQFEIQDHRCAHKVGTDGTLLGGWVDVKNAKRILDIGTGSGLIALMLAQRTSPDTLIEAIEISLPDYSQASENVKHSPWHKKLTVRHSSLQQFESTYLFECIVSNPPYFNNSFKPPNANRVVPRHTETLSFLDLIQHSLRLLTDGGTLNVILPFTEGLQFIDMAAQHSLMLSRKFAFRTRAEKPIERWLLEFRRTSHPLEEGEILLYHTGDEWSDDYKALTKDFYLKL